MCRCNRERGPRPNSTGDRRRSSAARGHSPGPERYLSCCGIRAPIRRPCGTGRGVVLNPSVQGSGLLDCLGSFHRDDGFVGGQAQVAELLDQQGKRRAIELLLLGTRTQAEPSCGLRFSLQCSCRSFLLLTRGHQSLEFAPHFRLRRRIELSLLCGHGNAIDGRSADLLPAAVPPCPASL